MRAGGLRLVIVVAMLLGAALGAALLGGGAAKVLGICAGLLLLLTIGCVVRVMRETVD